MMDDGLVNLCSVVETGDRENPTSNGKFSKQPSCKVFRTIIEDIGCGLSARGPFDSGKKMELLWMYQYYKSNKCAI